jgi:arginase
MILNNTIRLIGFPMDLGADRRGVDMGPSALRIADIDKHIEELGYKVIDDGDIAVKMQETQEIEDPQLKYLPEIVTSCSKLATSVKSIVDEGDFPLILGGDHSMSIGSIAGIAAHCKEQNKRLGVLWIDAHADMNTPETTPSGNIHGMPLATCLGIGDESLTNIFEFAPKIPSDRIVLIGLRSVDPGERTLIKEKGIKAYSMLEIDRQSIAKVIEETIIYFKAKKIDHLHISFDLDSVDPSIATGVGTPVPGGLSFREVHLIMETIAEQMEVSSFEIAEVNPILDTKNSSAELAVAIASSLFGKRILEV